MKREKIGLVGGAYEVMPASNWHPDILTSKLGPQYTDLSITELIEFHKNVKANEINELIKELKGKGFQIDEDEDSLSKIRRALAASLALEKLQIKENLTGIAVPIYQPGDVIITRIFDRGLDKIVLATGKFLKSSFEIIPGRVAFEMRLRNVEKWIEKGCLGNHFTFLPTNTLEKDLARLKLYCKFNNIKIVDCD